MLNLFSKEDSYLSCVLSNLMYNQNTFRFATTTICVCKILLEQKMHSAFVSAYASLLVPSLKVFVMLFCSFWQVPFYTLILLAMWFTWSTTALSSCSNKRFLWNLLQIFTCKIKKLENSIRSSFQIVWKKAHWWRFHKPYSFNEWNMSFALSLIIAKMFVLHHPSHHRTLRADRLS